MDEGQDSGPRCCKRRASSSASNAESLVSTGTASSKLDKNRPGAFSKYFDAKSLNWTDWNRVIDFTQTCKIDIQVKVRRIFRGAVDHGEIRQLYELEEMINEVFYADYTARNWTRVIPILSSEPDRWSAAASDLRVRILNETFMSQFNKPSRIDLENLTLHTVEARELVTLIDCEIGNIFRLMSRSESDIDDARSVHILRNLQEFGETFEDLLTNMDEQKQGPSELYCHRCFRSFLKAVGLTTLPSTPATHRGYLVPTLEWSETGLTRAEPDGIVVTKRCRRYLQHHAFAYLGVYTQDDQSLQEKTMPQAGQKHVKFNSSKETEEDKRIRYEKKKLEKEEEKARKKKAKYEQKKKEKIHFVQTETKLNHMDRGIKRSLGLANADVEQCIAIMNELECLDVSMVLLQKNPEIMNTIKKCRKYKCSDQIRTKAEFIYNKFKALFISEDGESAPAHESTELVAAKSQESEKLNTHAQNVEPEKMELDTTEAVKFVKDKCNNGTTGDMDTNDNEMVASAPGTGPAVTSLTGVFKLKSERELDNRQSGNTQEQEEQEEDSGHEDEKMLSSGEEDEEMKKDSRSKAKYGSGHSTFSRPVKSNITQCVQETLATVLPQHFIQLLIAANDTVFKTRRTVGGSREVSYYTKVGLIQQGMKVNVVMLKLPKESFDSLVISEEEAVKLKRSAETPECDQVESKVKKETSDLSDGSSGRPNKEADGTGDCVVEGTTQKPVKRVRFEEHPEEGATCRSKAAPLDLDPGQLYISRQYSLLKHEDRVELVQALVLLENIADDILADFFQ